MKKAAAARIALRCGLVFGTAFSACVAQEKSLPAPQADAPAERSPEYLSRHSESADSLLDAGADYEAGLRRRLERDCVVGWS